MKTLVGLGWVGLGSRSAGAGGADVGVCSRGFGLVFGRGLSALVAARRCSSLLVAARCCSSLLGGIGQVERRGTRGGSNAFIMACLQPSPSPRLHRSLFSPCTRSLLLPCRGRRALKDVAPLRALWPHDRPTASSSEPVCRFQPSPARSRVPQVPRNIQYHPSELILPAGICSPSLVQPRPLQIWSNLVSLIHLVLRYHGSTRHQLRLSGFYTQTLHDISISIDRNSHSATHSSTTG